VDHQSFVQLLGNYGEFVGAIAVVVTLGYLAVQIRLKHRESRQKEKQCAAQSLETENRYAIENS
jgi:hypothetical protein